MNFNYLYYFRKWWKGVLDMVGKIGFLFMVVLMSSNLFAAAIGRVDMKAIFLKADAVKTFEKDITKKREDYQELFEKRQDSIEKMKKRKKKESEIKVAVEKYENELRSKQDDLAQLEAIFQRELMDKVKVISEKLASKYGLDTVLVDQVVLYGGFDLTHFLIEELNKGDSD